jgi:hypothetical protein
LKTVILELNNRFKDTGFYVNAATTDIDQLIAKMSEFRQANRASQASLMDVRLDQNRKESMLQDGVVKAQFGHTASDAAMKSSGLDGLLFQRGQSKWAGAQGEGVDLGVQAADMISGTFAPTTSDQMSAQIGKYQNMVKLITDKRRELGTSLEGTSKSVYDMLGGMLDAINNGEAAVSKRLGLDAQGAGLQKQTDNAHFMASQTGSDFSGMIGTYQHKLGDLVSQNSGLDASGNPRVQNDTTKKAFTKALSDLYAEYEDKSKELISNLSEKDKASFQSTELPDDVKSFGSTLRKTATDAGLNTDSIDLQLQASAEKVIRARITALMAKVDSKTSLGEVQALPDQVREQYRLLTENQQRQNDIKRKTPLADGDSKEVADGVKANIAEVNTIKLGEETGKINDFLKAAGEKARETAEKASLVPKGLTDLANALKMIDGNFKRATKAATDIASDQRTRTAALSLYDNGNLNNISDVQRKDSADKQEAADRASEVGKFAALARQQSGLFTEAAKAASILADYKTQLANMGSAGSGSESENTTAGTLRKKVVEDIRDAEAKSATINQKLLDTDQARLELTRKINIENEKVASYGVGEGFNAAVEQWKQKSGELKSINALVIDSFTTVFSTADTSLSTFLTNVVTKTQTIGQAFKSMVASILKSMLDIAANKLASSILGAGLSFLGSAFGGIGAGTNVGSTAGVDMIGAMMQGGQVRAAQGLLVKGPISTRDSVDAKLQPGEFVSTQSTVSALGSDFFANLNATGGQSLIQTMAGMSRPPVPEKRVPDHTNVYVTTQPPPATLGAKDVIAAVTDDMMRGGVTKRLIKSIAMGG